MDLYELIDDRKYRELISEWDSKDDVQKLVNYQKIKIDGFDLEEIEVLGYRDDEPTGKIRAVLYKTGDISPKFLITKIFDEYFIVDKIEFSRRYGLSHQYFKCDQMDGVINCLNDIKYG